MSGVAWYGWAILWVALIALFWVAGTAILLGVGILFAPIAGVLTGYLARRKGHPFISGFWRSAFYSASGLLPWIYVVVTMKGWVMPRFLVVSGFISMHVSWLMAIFAFLFFIFTSVEDFNFDTNYDLRLPVEEITVIFGLLSGFYWLVATSRLMEKHRNQRNEDLADVPRMPSISNVLHFTFPTAWVIGAIFVYVGNFVIFSTNLDAPETSELIIVLVTVCLLIVATTVWTLWGFRWKLSIEPGS